MNQFNFLIVSKEAWSDVRWARKQWLPYFLGKEDDVQKIIYLDRHAAWWRGERAHQEQQAGKISIQQDILCLPFERWDFGRSLNRRKVAHKISQQLIGNVPWVSILYHPFDYEMMEVLQQKSHVIFDWTEDWSLYHDEKDMGELQRKCVVSADTVFCVTQSLKDLSVSWRGSERGVYFVPNATALTSIYTNNEPKVLENIPQPRIGFVGHAGPWFDEELVANIAKERPNVHWVMMGGVGEKAKQALEKLKNVHFMGVFLPKDLMPMMLYCNILVAPYTKGIQGDATKLYDYLVAKKPIVSTECETANTLGAHVELCNTLEEWLSTIDDILLEIHIQKVAVDDDFLDYTWQTRAKQVLKLLHEHIHV